MHAKSHKHQRAADQLKSSPSVSSYFTCGPREMKIFDIRWSVAIACHAAIRATDHLGEIINKSSRKTDFLHGMKHHRTKCSSILTNVVHPCLHDSVIKDIQQTSFSLIIDESTDVSITKHLCMCVRYFKEDIPSVVTKFLTLLPVISCTASSLFSDIKLYFDAHSVPMSHIIGLGTDGASNLCGAHNSVYTKIKEHAPHCVLVKCICHSLSLCRKDAFSELPSILSFLLSEVAKWVKFSSLRRSDYDELFHVMNANIPNLHPTKFISPSETRWLVTGKVINSVITQWHELTAYFSCIKYTKNFSCKSLLEMLNDRSNYLYLVFAAPLINEFEQINASFQHTNADQCRLFKDLDVFYMSLRSRICKNEYVQKYEKIQDAHLKPIKDIQFGAKFYQELSESKLSSEQVLNIKYRCLSFLKTAVDKVSMRLPEKFKFWRHCKLFTPMFFSPRLDLFHFKS